MVPEETMTMLAENGTRGALLMVAGILAFVPPTLAQPLDRRRPIRASSIRRRCSKAVRVRRDDG
jgi:hypothetical protein